MQEAQQQGNISDKEAYQTWNMGNGMLIITPEPDFVVDIAKQHFIDAKVCGRVIEEKKIKIGELQWSL